MRAESFSVAGEQRLRSVYWLQFNGGGGGRLEEGDQARVREGGREVGEGGGEKGKRNAIVVVLCVQGGGGVCLGRQRSSCQR